MMGGLRATGISHAFGKRLVLDNVSVEISGGQIACLLGPSGCGKTTLLRIIAGLERLQAGRVEIGDRIMADSGAIDLPPEDRAVGLMFQDYALFPHLTVFENVSFGVPNLDRSARLSLEDRLASMGLAAYRDRYPHQLSGGQQQRVALLRATAPNPAMLLLDEPFTGLDTTLRSQVRDQALEYLARHGQTAMMVTHDPEEAMYMADLLFVMDAGKIVQAGNPIDVYSRPETPFVAGLFGPLNSIPAENTGSGRIETPLGTIDGQHLKSGQTASVLVRPEHIKVLPKDAPIGIPVSVLWCRSIGRSTQVRLVSIENPNLAITARVEGAFAGNPRDEVRIEVAREHVLVFTND